MNTMNESFEQKHEFITEVACNQFQRALQNRRSEIERAGRNPIGGLIRSEVVTNIKSISATRYSSIERIHVLIECETTKNSEPCLLRHVMPMTEAKSTILECLSRFTNDTNLSKEISDWSGAKPIEINLA